MGACSVFLWGATFTSTNTGSWSNPATWTVVGVDGDGIPDSNDDVFLSASVTVSLTVANNICRDLTISAGTFQCANSLRIYGNLTKTGGSVTGNSSWLFYSTTGSISGTFTNQGNWYFTASSVYSILAGSVIQKNNNFRLYTNAIVTNNGTVRLTGGSVIFVNASAQFINAANSTLQVADDISGNGTLNCAANPNTMIYTSSLVAGIRAQTYHHLTIQNSGTTIPALSGSISVNGNFTLTSTTLNMANFSIFLSGNWVNNANTTCQNMGQVIFMGSGAQSITRAVSNTETFGSIVVAGLGTVTLGDSIQVNGNIDISAGTLDVSANNYSIRVTGNFNDNSTFTAQQGTVFFTGTAAQNIDGFATTTFYNITSSNAAGVTVNFTKQISNILTVSAGSFGPSGFGAFIMLATGATTYAKIAPLGATASLVGSSWSIQTYINGPATAYWQYLGTPTNSPTLQDWDGDTRFYMSGVGGNDGNACCPIFYSVRTYNTTTNTYANINSVSTTLVNGRGYMVWMADNLSSLTAPLIFDTRGTPNFNTVNRVVIAGGAGSGYNLVSNPYACPVTYASVRSASSATLGANFMILQENGSYATNPNGGTIAPAQGFMCVATTAGNMTFTESCKTTATSPNVIRQMAGNEFRVKAGNQVNGLGEEAIIKLNPGGSESMDLEVDMPYLPSPYENATHIYTHNSLGEQFLLNNLGTEEDHLLIPLSLTTSTPGVQLLTFKDMNTVTEYNCAWLEDLTTGARVNLNQVDTYTYEDNELGSTRNFIIHFERTNDCSYDLQSTVASLDAQTNVFVTGEQIFAQFEFETEETVTISMYDLSGRMVTESQTMNVGTQTIALERPDAHGIYLVRIQKGNELVTKKIYY